MNKSFIDICINATHLAIDTILPSRCPSCGEIIKVDPDQSVGGQGGFCPSCWSDLKFITPPWCISCAIPFEFADDIDGPIDPQHDHRKCGACLEKPPLHDGIRAALIYDEIPRKVILKLKYGGRIAIANLIAGHMRRFIADDIAAMGDDIWITPVPLHWTRLWKRTYNQSALICDGLIEQWAATADPLQRLDHIVDLIKRIKRTPPLKGGNAKQRHKLLKNAFAINRKYKDSIKGRSIILVDDVYTSGATTNACARALKAAGADKVIIYCWTRVIK